MGNCIRHESPMHWGGDDWGTTLKPVPPVEEDERGLKPSSLSSPPPPPSSSSSSVSTEVKIKITKKQLEELLGRVDMKELSVSQVIAMLMMSRRDQFESDQRAWRPKLQSIPESS